MAVPGTGSLDEPIQLRTGETARIEARPTDQNGQPYTGELTGGKFFTDFSSIDRGVSVVTDPDGLRATLTGLLPLQSGYGDIPDVGVAEDLTWSALDSWGVFDDIQNFIVVVLDATQFLFDQASPWTFTLPNQVLLGISPSLTATPADARDGGTYKVDRIAWSTERQSIELATRPDGRFYDTIVQTRYWPGKGPARPTRFGPPPDYLKVYLRPKASFDASGDRAAETLTITAFNSTGRALSSSIVVRVLKASSEPAASKIVQI